MGKLLRRLRHLLYQLRCLWRPYNVLKIHELPRTWTDRDDIMFHAMFQILVDFVELEQPLVHWEDHVSGRFMDRQAMWEHIINWYGPNSAEHEHYDEETLKRHYEFHTEMLTLYEWYKDKKYDFDAKYNAMTSEDLDGDGILKKLINWNEYHELEQKHELACDDMLRRLLAIRRYLWT